MKKIKKLFKPKSDQFDAIERIPHQHLTSYGKILDHTRGAPIRIVMICDLLSEQFSLLRSQCDASTLETDIDKRMDIPDGNILIIAGNMTKTGSLAEYEKFNEFLTELCSLKKFNHIVLIPGEHDRTLDETWSPSRRDKPDFTVSKTTLLNNLPSTVHYLHDSSITLYGLNIYGTPWVTTDSNVSSLLWGFNVTENEAKRKWRAIPRNCDILITQMPPYEIGDSRHDITRDSIIDDEQVAAWDRKGSKSLLKRIKKVNPQLHVFGREPAGYGGYRWSESVKRKAATDRQTCFVNASICDEDFFASHRPLVVDIDVKTPEGYMELIGNESVTDYDKRFMDLYVASLVALRGITLEDNEKEVLFECLHLATTSQQSEVVATTSATALLTSAPQLAMQEHLVLTILDKYGVINNLAQCRKQARGADENSASDFAYAQLVIPGLYIGGHHMTQSREALQQLGITHICACYLVEPAFPTDFKYHVIDIEDEVGVDITSHFHSCTRFIESAIRGNGRVYVHCQLGMSRSATICMAYLMQMKNATFIQAHALVKRARPFICPNDSFVQQLKDLEDTSSIGC
jgi:Icc-related predicted phosphoesterase